MRGLAAISPQVELLRRELQSNNVQPGQEPQYFQSKNRPLDPNLLFMIQTNRAERANQPQQQPVMSSVLQDKITQALQQAQPQPLPPPAVMQQQAIQAAMAARQAQNPQMQGAPQRPQTSQQGGQGGIAPLPFRGEGFARGGIVAFAEGDYIGGDDSGYDEEGKDEDETPTQQTEAQIKASEEADKAAAATKLFGRPMSQIALQQYQEATPESYRKADEAVRKLDSEETARKQAELDKLGKEKGKDRSLALAAAAFGAVGKHSSPWGAIGDVGFRFASSSREIDSLYRTAEEKKKDALHQLKLAAAMREAGYFKDSMAAKQKALTTTINAKRYEDAAEAAKQKAAAPKGLTNVDAIFLSNQSNLQDKLDALNPKDPNYESQAKAIRGRMAANEGQYRRMQAAKPQEHVAGIGAASRERIAAGRVNVDKYIADLKAGTANDVQTNAAFKNRVEYIKQRLPGDVLSGRMEPGSEEELALKKEYDDLQAGLNEVATYMRNKGRGGTPAAAPVKLSPEDEQALQWANANPKDPRAQQIKDRLKVK